VFAGVDVGNVLNVTVSEVTDNGLGRLIWAEELFFDDDFSKLIELIRRYPNMRALCIDARPETRMVNQLIKLFPGKVFKVEYIESIRELVVNYEESLIKVDRTYIMDEVLSVLSAPASGMQGWELPMNAAELCNGNFYEQLIKPTRVFLQGEGTKEGKYTWLGAPDHFYHAFGYMKMARHFITGKAVHKMEVGSTAKPTSTNDNYDKFKDHRQGIILPANVHPSIRMLYEEKRS